MQKAIRQRKMKKFPVAKFVTYLALVLYTLVLFAAFLVIICTSFMSDYEIGASDFHLFPYEWIGEGYELIFTLDPNAVNGMPSLLIGFFNTMWQTLIPTTVSLFVSALVAFVYSKFRFPGRKIFFLANVFMMMLPLGAFGFVGYLFYVNIGWVGGTRGLLPLIIPGLFGSAGTIFFLRTYYDSALSNEVVEAAKIDGAGTVRLFFSIALPLGKPAILAQFLFALFDNAAYRAAFEASGVPRATSGSTVFTIDRGYVEGDDGWVRCIDFSPYIDPDTGEKYLYWSQTPGAIAGVRMIDWFTPDWSTYKTLTACGFYTVDDYVKYMNGENVDKVTYEEMASYCNEGPFMLKHNGKYYLTFSIGSYLESSYGVMQAVSDSPLGPFRKLTDAENGMLLSNDLGENHAVGGPGHHSFFTVNVDGAQKLMIAYHAHTNLYTYADRAVRFDEVKWVTVEGADGKPLDVMHLNGPTVTTQPSFGIGKEYGDISGAMERISLIRGELAEGSAADNMIDGIFSCFTVCSRAFEEKYAAAASVVQTSTFEIALESPRELRGIMFYNANVEEEMFERIKNIAFICEENGQEKVYLIPELAYSQECNQIYNIVTGKNYAIFGGGCYAEFASLANVKAIRFTVEVLEGKESVGVAEVALVGKFAGAQA